MVKLIKLEMKKLSKPLLIATPCFIALSVILVFMFSDGYSYQYNIEVWTEAYTLVLFLFPIFCTAPLTWLLYYEKKMHYLNYAYIRTSPRRYMASKLIVHSVYGFLISFLMSFLMLLVSLYVIGPVDVLVNPLDVYKQDIFINHPFYYGLMVSIWRGLLAVLFVILGFLSSLVFNNYFLVMIFPFAYYLLENIILSIINLPYFRIVTAIGIVSGGYTINFKGLYLLVGPCILICFMLIITLAYKRQNKLK